VALLDVGVLLVAELVRVPLLLPGLLTREVEACIAADWPLPDAPADDVTLPSVDVPPLPLLLEVLPAEAPFFPAFDVTTRLVALLPAL
jgi:hypothetical protein